MSHTLTLELDDEIYSVLERHARTHGMSVARWLSSALERPDGPLADLVKPDSSAGAKRPAAARRFEEHFGTLDLGQPTGLENASIDRDLAEAYLDSHRNP